MAYLNNIIIYFNSKEEYFKYIKWVQQKLINKKMLIAIKKCKFYITKIKFYKFIVCTNLMVQVSCVQGHEIRLVLYAHLDGGDCRFY